MDLLQHFQAYAAAFEETYVDDDWSRLETFFIEDAVYEVRGLPNFPIHAEGRDAIFAAIKGALDGFDRRCDSRDLSPIALPKVEGHTVSVYWQGIYTLKGAPDLKLIGYEDAVYNEDGKIVHLIDRYDETAAKTLDEWMTAVQEVQAAQS